MPPPRDPFRRYNTDGTAARKRAHAGHGCKRLVCVRSDRPSVSSRHARTERGSHHMRITLCVSNILSRKSLRLCRSAALTVTKGNRSRRDGEGNDQCHSQDQGKEHGSSR